MKKVIWVGSSRRDVRAMPGDVKDEIGFALYHVELELSHSSIKTLKGFGSAGVQEIKVNDSTGTYRAVYTIRFKGFLYVLHAFKKKSKRSARTPQSDLDLIKQRVAWAQQDFTERSQSHD